MEYVASKILIAGAGAGKTHDLSELVLNEEIQENKNIYVITSLILLEKILKIA